MKNSDCVASHLTPLDLLGDDETALSKAFAYVLAKDQQALFTFLRFVGVRAKNTEKNYLATTVEIEHSRPEGRTDIELLNPRSFHVIIECKVDSGKVSDQRTKYLHCFQNIPHRVMCFITQQRDTNKQKQSGISTRHLSWLDILDVFEGARLQANPITRQFMSYAIRTHRMKAQKEILVQDLSDSVELKRYTDYAVYRRDVTFGTPLYFAPYFTKVMESDVGKGMKYLSPILGVLTLMPSEIKEYLTDLQSFSEDSGKVQKWMKGVMLEPSKSRTKEKEYTFYFLGDPVELPNPLLKDGTIKKGRGKNWIARRIPKNRCVTFAEIIRRLNDGKGRK
ncbi:MAG: hypothetical protein ACREI2_04630 [Nitrospiraceae bacterium]